MSSQLVWQIVKKYNSFYHKGLHGAHFSREQGNLFNKHSYKYSGISNTKTVDIRPGEDNAVVVTKSRPKQHNKPLSAKQTNTIKKKNGRRVAKALGKDVGRYRPDLKHAALARLSAIQKSSRVMAAAKR